MSSVSLDQAGATSSRPFRVAILQRRLVQYRLALFDELRAECARRGIELHLVYGEASVTDSKRNDGGSLPWADEVKARWFNIRGADLLWQQYPSDLTDVDLVVMTQENKIVSNYRQLLRRAVGRGGKTAYWGHGRNLQSTNPDGPSERWKRLLVNRIDWWFAYTQGTVDYLTGSGFPPERITRLDNAIDDVTFRADLDSVEPAALSRLRTEIDLADGAPLALHCGSLYREKRLDDLIEIGDHIHRSIPGFRLVIVGDGPERPRLESLLASRPWARCVGTQTGLDKAAWFRLAVVQINPGLVGLHVLDSFVAGVPLVTTRDAPHGPEIEYLDDGVNGLFATPDPARFAAEVIDLVSDTERLRAMVDAGRKSAQHYTLANMVNNFADGICTCLGIDSRGTGGVDTGIDNRGTGGTGV
ncbi:MAG: glycosyltransferase family 4 protein [Acidimicrobiia bacterium]|nr:glycosyltransferase family 4 protein [Acidimicrobiia bacterium]